MLLEIAIKSLFCPDFDTFLIFFLLPSNATSFEDLAFINTRLRRGFPENVYLDFVIQEYFFV